ncbi:MAG: ABC transporter ATP-binding protein [Christensenellaceae bacterium]|nr:ABC transporter ATP-binding protein [Christensenellaceae bacterium]
MSRIEVKNVTKKFGAVTALDDVSVTIEENKIYGLLGRNGAGKSTLLSIITNRVFPTSGEVLIDGEPVLENDRVLGKVYCMSEQPLYPESMRIKEVFKWTREFYPDMDMDYALALADKFALSTRKRLKSLSTGYTSIYKIIVALACNAPVLLLDEPVLGLDANFRDVFYRELIARYSEQPRTVVISTHLIEEAADVVEHVLIINNGRIILDDSTQNVLAAGCTVTGPAALVDEYVAGRRVLGSDTLGGIKSVYLLGLPDAPAPAGVELSRMKLQSLFIHLTNA